VPCKICLKYVYRIHVSDCFSLLSPHCLRKIDLSQDFFEILAPVCEASTRRLKPARKKELYLPQHALGELYYGAYRSGRLERSLAQIERFLDAVDLLRLTRKRPSFTVRSLRSTASVSCNSQVQPGWRRRPPLRSTQTSEIASRTYPTAPLGAGTQKCPGDPRWRCSRSRRES
jgi:hypothetical protein